MQIGNTEIINITIDDGEKEGVATKARNRLRSSYNDRVRSGLKITLLDPQHNV